MLPCIEFWRDLGPIRDYHGTEEEEDILIYSHISMNVKGRGYYLISVNTINISGSTYKRPQRPNCIISY